MKKIEAKPGKPVIGTILLLLLPWLMLQVVERTFPGFLVSLFGTNIKPGPFIALAPLHLLLAVGIIIAWRHRFPLWSYTWIGTLYFFLYRECFEMVLKWAPKMIPEKTELIIYIFYWGINPLALILLLTLISRRDWLLACVTAYPYTSILQAWYTLDTTPVLVLVISLLFYLVFFLPLLTDRSRTLKFLSLLAGTIAIGVGFFLYDWPGFPNFLILATRLICIIIYPVIIFKIPIFRRLLGIKTVERGV